MKRLLKRLVPYMSRIERRLSVPKVILALAVLGAAAAVAVLVTAVLLVVAPASDAFRAALAVLLVVGLGAAAAFAALQALSLRLQARVGLDMRAARADLGRLASAATSGRQLQDRVEATSKDLLVSMRSLGLGVQASLDSVTAQQRAMLTTVLETVARTSDGVQALEPQLQRRLEENRTVAYRQVEALMSLHSVLPVRHPLPELGDWAVSPDAAASLVSLVLELRPRVVVELGSGVSTVLIGYALELLGNGRVIAIEHDQGFAGKTRHDLHVHGLDAHASVLDAPLVPTSLGDESFSWYDVSGLDVDGIDLLFVDGPPALTGPLARYPAVPVLWDRLSAGACVVLDDADRPDEKLIVERWLGAHEGLEVSHLAHERGSALLRRRR